MCNSCENKPKQFKIGDKAKTLDGEIVTVIAPYDEHSKALAEMGFVDYIDSDGERDFSHSEDLTPME